MVIKPSRGCVIVRPVSTEEKRPGSPIILLDDTREKLANHQMFVVSVGGRESCGDYPDCERPEHAWEPDGSNSLHFAATRKAVLYPVHPTDRRIKPDAWILVKPRSLVEISSADKLYSVRISDVVGVFCEESDALTDSAA